MHRYTGVSLQAYYKVEKGGRSVRETGHYSHDIDNTAMWLNHVSLIKQIVRKMMQINYYSSTVKKKKWTKWKETCKIKVCLTSTLSSLFLEQPCWVKQPHSIFNSSTSKINVAFGGIVCKVKEKTRRRLFMSWCICNTNHKLWPGTNTTYFQMVTISTNVWQLP